ncbi:hypothetical protein HA402_015237 [Bradysia odoriphaga]|nr:hypothetical protein HA402_015237 [Bradysia odoriphaga]
MCKGDLVIRIPGEIIIWIPLLAQNSKSSKWTSESVNEQILMTMKKSSDKSKK